MPGDGHGNRRNGEYYARFEAISEALGQMTTVGVNG